MKRSPVSSANPTQSPRLALIAVALVCLLAPRSSPASGVVTNCTEADLRAALTGGGTVTFDCDGVITLASTLTIGANTILDGSGHSVVISGNNAVSPFVVQAGVEFSITNVTIANGFSSILGGGIRNFGVLNVVDCTFLSNAVVSPFSGAGGAINNHGILRARGSTFAYNRASLSGGAVACGFGVQVPGPVFLTNCTFVGNVSSNGTTIAGGSTNPSYVVHCTLAGNQGGGVSGAYTLVNTILANQSSSNCFYAVGDGGNNISSDGSCGFTHPASRINTDPLLGPLGDHGGRTLTFSLMAGSPATDAASASGLSVDQRGYPKPYGMGPDIGAFETTLIGTNPGAFQLSTPATQRAESLAELLFTVTRVAGAFGAATVNFATSDLDATAGADYFATNGTLLFAPGEVQKSFTVRLLDDDAQESDEMFMVTLSVPTGGATLGNPSFTSITIVDDETPAIVSSCDEPSLRAAIAARPVVVFSCDGVIPLASTLAISSNTRLDASGRNVSLSGSNGVRLFLIQPGAALELRHLTLADGFAHGANGNAGQSGESAQGGAICNSNGVLNAYNCSFLRHRAQGGNGGPATVATLPNPGSGGAASGGAIYNWLGWVNLSNCVFVGNRAEGGRGGGFGNESSPGGEARGGAICNINGVVRMAGAILSSNVAVAGLGNRFGHASAYGGAFFNLGDASLLTCTLRANSAIADSLVEGGGGGLSHHLGVLDLTDCTVSHNRALGGQGLGIATPLGIPGGPGKGGGLYIVSGQARLTNTTLAYNWAVGGAGVPSGTPAGQGGGIFNAGQSLLLNSTLAGNVALGGQGRASSSGNGEGGGLYNAASGNSTLTHVTIARNAAEPGAGGFPSGLARGGAIATAGGMVNLRNTILALSLSGSNCWGAAFMDEGHNLSSDASCPFTSPESVSNADPLLGPLFDFGGPTPTMALLANSPAIDAAAPAFCTLTDQRGRVRPFGAGCDMGAFESSAPYAMLGQITGFLPSPDPIVVSYGINVEPIDSTGEYAIHGFAAGSYLITPTSPECVFVLSNRLVNIGTDVIGVDFHSYRSNALFMEPVSGPAARAVFAGEAGATYRVLFSDDLSTWAPWSTNTTASSGLFEILDPAPLSPMRFFQVVWP